MWWLIGLLAAIAAAGNNNSRNAIVNGSNNSTDSGSRTLTYRSTDGTAFFRFRFTLRGNDVRIHILEFPNPGTGSCHVLHDSHGPYVCWSKPIPSMDAAKRVAAIWAEATLVYQRTGRVF